MDKAEIDVHNNYQRKYEHEGSHHKLIYGSIIDKDECIQTTDLFKRYSLPIYGYPEEGEHFIGFEYGRINGLYDHLHYTYQGELTFTQAQVPEEIKRLFKETYPELIGSCQAIIQNVRNSHYTSGNLMYGYWIITKKDEYDDWHDEIFDISSGADFTDGNKLGLEITSVGHNMEDTNTMPSEFLIGMRIATFTANEGEGDHQDLAKQLSKSYSSDGSGLPSRNEILVILHRIHPDIQITLIPMLCLVQQMCYCCT